ncbi:hypothetical protein ANO11243_090430 [Dothideomycetidae sp. 11243]|nr:hypothetical protein ANO11243_090430 [fungal sp. No.11243]
MPSKSKSKSALESTTTAPPSAKPDWPLLRPALPPDQLHLTSLLPQQILTTPLLSSSLAKEYRLFLSTLPLICTPTKPKKGEAARFNDRFQVTDAAFAEHLWTSTGLASLVLSGDVDGAPLSEAERKALWGGEVLGLSPNIRIYRYAKGQFFAPHYDDSVVLDEGRRTTWTLLVYLSGPATGCVGGETVFYPDAPRKGVAPEPPVVAELAVGLALLHRHGNECMLHEGRPVTEGEKWVIRSDLVVRR